MTWSDWYFWGPMVVIVLVLVVLARWVLSLQRRVSDFAERIAYLEAKVNGRNRHG